MDTVTHKITATFTDPSGGFLYWMAFGPGGTTLATSNGNGSIYLRDVATHEITATLTNPHDKSITAVVFGPGRAPPWPLATATAALTDGTSRSTGPDNRRICG